MLNIVNLKKEFINATTAIYNLNLTINEGEFFSLLGPSGCGKTTLLRIIAGLEVATSGEIRLNQERIDLSPPQKRPFNLVFQKYALFPHLSVFENVAFGLRNKKLPEVEISKRVEETLKLVNMGHLKDRFPETLSGGQAQRVALARALANKPKILLLDEPLSALDLKLREHMQIELKALQKKTGLTFIYVTHDQEEAFALSDRIAVMNEGKIEQVGTPEQLYSNPESLFVAKFIGQMSGIDAEIQEVNGKIASLKSDHHSFKSTLHSSCPLNKAAKTLTFIRPEKINLYKRDEKPSEAHFFLAKIESKIFRGDCVEWRVRIDDKTVLASVSYGEEMDVHHFKVDEVVLAAFDTQNAMSFAR
jgi:spermidine/putrescine transport system ATP-binding protein